MSSRLEQAEAAFAREQENLAKARTEQNRIREALVRSDALPGDAAYADLQGAAGKVAVAEGRVARAAEALDAARLDAAKDQVSVVEAANRKVVDAGRALDVAADIMKKRLEAELAKFGDALGAAATAFQALPINVRDSVPSPDTIHPFALLYRGGASPSVRQILAYILDRDARG